MSKENPAAPDAIGDTDVIEKFAKEAYDLNAARKSVEDAAAVGTGLWLSYLFMLVYLGIAAGAVTHKDLLLENPVKLPFLGDVPLPLIAFFVLAPIIFIVSHAYTLVHLVMLAAKVGVFNTELRAQLGDSPETKETKERVRRQLPSNIFVQILAGPEDIRGGALGFLSKVIAWTSLVIGPVLLLLLIQVQFLPYHHEWVTLVQRLAVLADVVLLWALWPAVLNGRSEITWPQLWRHPVLALASLVPIFLAFTAATFPGEHMDDWIGKRQWIPPTITAWLLQKDDNDQPEDGKDQPAWTSLHDLLFNGKYDEKNQRRRSPFSNTLLLPGFDALESAKIDENKLAAVKQTFARKKQHFESALFRNADLRKANLDNAFLQNADLYQAKLQDARFYNAQLQGASLYQAELQRASLNNAELQGADLYQANLQGADLYKAKLQGADLYKAQLQGALLKEAELQGAWLEQAELQGVSLYHAHLQGVSLYHAHLQGASLEGAELQGAPLEDAHLQGASLDGARLQGASLVGAELQGASLKGAHLEGVSLKGAQLQGASLEGAHLQGASLEGAQLQGASLEGAQLQGARFLKSTFAGTNMRNVAVWRTSLDDASLTAVFEDGVKESAISRDELATLQAMIVKEVPKGGQHEQALKRIEILNPDRSGNEASARVILEKERGDETAYLNSLADQLKSLACSSDENTRYIVRGLVLNGRIKDTGGKAPGLVDAILRPNCPVFAALTEADKAALKGIANEASGAP